MRKLKEIKSLAAANRFREDGIAIIAMIDLHTGYIVSGVSCSSASTSSTI